MPAENPFEIGELILSELEGLFTDESVELPTHRYVHSGAIAHDCEQVVVSCQGLERDGIGPRLAVFDAEIVRCVPAISEAGNPTPSALEQSAEALLADARLLFRLRSSEALNACRSYDVREMAPIGPEGGFGGWRMRLAVGW